MNATSLKKKADELYAPRLARGVKKQIDAAYDAKPGGISAQSIATAWRGDRLYRDLRTGTFEGRIQLLWNGMDSFICRPDSQQPFSYTTADGRTITPKLMETDGGSVPRAIRGLSKFSSWGYAPAFILHDWLYVAHKCDYGPDNDWTFEQTAVLMAEAIKTLMAVGYTDYDDTVQKLAKAEDTLYLLYQAVASGIARNVWDDASTVRCLV